MGQRHVPTGDGLTIDDAAARLEAETECTGDDLLALAHAAVDHAGDLAAVEYGRSAAALGALRLASRRTRGRTLEAERLAAVARDADLDAVVGAESLLAQHLSPPADDEVIRSLRRRLIVARELLAAAENGRVAGPTLPGSALADAAPDLLARAAAAAREDDAAGGVDGDTGGERSTLDPDRLRTHVERLEADRRCARRGVRLDALVEGDD